VNPIVALVVAALLLLVNAFFVAAEFALLASRRSRLEHMADSGDRKAARALRGIRRLTLMLAGAQLGITMASLGLGAVAEPAVAHLFEDVLHVFDLRESVSHAIAFVLGLGIVVFLHMVVGEMFPKSLAIADPERSARLLSGPFGAFVTAFRPFIRALNSMANGVVRLVRVQPQEDLAMAHSSSDLALLLHSSIEEGKLGQAEVEVFGRALQLSGLRADEAMTPRQDIAYVGRDESVDVVEAKARASGHSRLLVVGDGVDDPLGVVHVRDVLVLDDEARATTTAGAIARPMLVAHGDQPLEDVLLDLRSHHVRFAVVVDDLGVVSGVTTVRGLVDALVGGG
jgi:CBS domain containing-hemolysin-like protein